MAMTPELQTLIDVLHEPHREDGWAERLQDGFDDLRKSIATENDSLAVIAIGEMLRQRVDERIMDDVVQTVGGADGAAGFAAGIVEKSKNWGADPLKARREVEVGRKPRETEGYFLSLDQNLGAQLQDAAVKADIPALLNIIVALLGLRQTPAADMAGAENAGAGVGASAPEGVITGMYQTAEGEALFAYMDKALTDANQAHGVKSYTKGEEGATSNSLDPDEMYEMFRTKIADDIARGTFPLAGLEVEDAEKIANIIKVQALDGISREPWGRDYSGNVTYSFNPDNSDLNRAIDVILSGSQSLVAGQAEVVQSADGQHAYTAGGYAAAYRRFMNESNAGAAMTAEDMVAAFKPLLEGHYISDLPEETNQALAEARTLVDQYTRPDGTMRKMPEGVDEEVASAKALLAQYKDFEGQYIPPEINIPADRHQAFNNKLREAFAESARPGPDGQLVRDAATFGSIMAEEFTVVEQSGVHEALRQDVYDHGPAIALKLGAETETSIEVLDMDGARAFEFSDLVQGGFSVYSVNGDKGNFHLQEISAVENVDDLRRVFGEEFEIRTASIPDFDLDSGNSQLSGYFVSSQNGNSFYIGFDAMPESRTSDSFRAQRQQDSDTISREPLADADYTIGQPVAGMKR